jgi:hypothetical protein
MSNILEENEIHLNQNVRIVEENHKPVGLFKELFEVNGIERDIDLLLSTRKKKRNSIRQMIALMSNIDVRRIRRVKLRFRKHIQGYSSGIEGTRAYQQLLKLQKIKRLFSRYHIKKHPFRPKSKTIHWSRHLFTSLNDLKV